MNFENTNVKETKEEGKVESTNEVQDTISKAEAFEKAQADFDSSKKVEESKAKEGVGAAQKKIYKFKEGSVGVTVEVDGNQAERIKIPEGLQKLNISVEDIEKLKQKEYTHNPVQYYNEMVILLAKKTGEALKNNNFLEKVNDRIANFLVGYLDEESKKQLTEKLAEFEEDRKEDDKETRRAKRKKRREIKDEAVRDVQTGGDKILSLRLLIESANKIGSESSVIDGISSNIKKLTGYKDTNILSKIFGKEKNPHNINEQMILDLAKTTNVDVNIIQKINEAVKAGEKYNKLNYTERVAKTAKEGKTYGGSAGTSGSIMADPEFLINFKNLPSKYSEELEPSASRNKAA